MILFLFLFFFYVEKKNFLSTRSRRFYLVFSLLLVLILFRWDFEFVNDFRITYSGRIPLFRHLYTVEFQNLFCFKDIFTEVTQ